MKKKTLINRFLALIFIVILLIMFADIINMNLVGIIFLIIIFAYLKIERRITKKNGYNLLNIILLLTIFLAISDVIVKNQFPWYLIPYCLIPMLATILFSDLQLSLLISIILSMVLGLLTRGDLYSSVIMLNSGIACSLLVFGIRRRSQIIQAGVIVGIVQAFSLLFMQHFKIIEPMYYLFIFLNGCICGIIVVGVLPIFEYLFKTTTNISLLELSDFNHPILKEMILKAPGTYHHSLVVGNLSEAACEAIGANALLARIGSYYHDIGKIEKAEYFIENQMANIATHENLSPSMSKLVIINHVKGGQELAQKYKLNPQIVDFILQHHGTSLVYYFYRRALETQEKDAQLEEERFRYPGPKPNTKETAIVLLADSVEAASRTVKDPNAAKMEELVHKVINNKFIDGQLDECDLTLKDLEKIAGVFIRILVHIYHARVPYPEKETKNINKKSARQKDSHRT